MIYKTSKYNKLIYCLIALVAFILFTFTIKKYFKPFFVIILMLFLSTPIYNFLSDFNILNKRVWGAVSILLVNFFIIALLFYIGNWIFSIKDILIEKVLKFIGTIEGLSNFFNVPSINKELEKYYSMILNSNFIRKGALYTTDSIVNYFIGNIMTYFILVDKYVILNWIKTFIPNTKIYMIKEKVQDAKNILKIEIVLVILTTIQTILGLMALNIDNYLVLGILSGILDILPYVGTILIFAPLIIYYISIKNYIIAFGIFCLYILLLVNRQIMETKFISRKFKLHPLPTILSIYIGLKTFGLVGMLLAPLYVIICKSILDNN
ncbi:AI-2E family transporter [Clostridium rectalis]|uniref:AI-2E family transporter n=1 Tax=Clostridium rectalis TaxID=2040295 RepID=UPI001FA9CC75|nr:AI-2E family transporter [Clostridium rectalis]